MSVENDADKLAAIFLDKVRDRNLVVGIMGLGYVGLPLMLACTAAGFRVIGFDINAGHVQQLNAGKSPLDHIDDAAIAAAGKARLFEASADFSRPALCRSARPVAA